MNLSSLFLLVIFPCSSYAQNFSQRQADSLKSESAKYMELDSIKVNQYIAIGNAYLVGGNEKYATLYTDTALMLAQKIKWVIGIAVSYRQKGVISMNKYDFENAIISFQCALKEGASINNEKLNSSIELNLGLIYLETEEYQLALESFKKSLAYGEKSLQPEFLTYSLNNIGITFLRMNEPDSAIYYLERGKPLAIENKLEQVLSFNYSHLGAAYNAKKDYKTALKYFIKGFSKATEIGDISSLAQAAIGMAEVHTYLNNFNIAISYCLQANDLAKQLGNLQYQKEACSMLSDNYYSLKKYEKALIAYKNFIDLRDSIMNDEKKSELVKRDLQFKNEKEQAIAHAELKRETERKNIFIISGLIILLLAVTGFILYKRNRDTEQRRKEMAATLRFKNTELKTLRLQMNPHFIDNALQSIQHYINEHKTEEADEYLVKFSSLMRAMLMNSESEEITIAKELATLEWYMQLENLRMKFPFEYKLEIDTEINLENSTIPPNILQPFVENSIKHGLFPKDAPGCILIKIYKKRNELHIIIEDNGVGRTNTKQVQQSTFFKQESLGIKITQERLNILSKMRNINATLNIVDLNENNLPKGTRIELSIPMLQ